MGGGFYCSTSRAARSEDLGYTTKSASEIFSKSVNNAMSPYGLDIRESRDSKDHPESLAIILALDITGSMMTVPHYLLKEGFLKIMDRIIKGGIKDPQILFLGIGDHVYDKAPLQVGQFESSDELLDKWLTTLWLEGGGGGNEGESYLLSWYLAGHKTSIDCFEKRKQKGILITIGDEPCLPSIYGRTLKEIFGNGQYPEEYNKAELLEKAKEKYEIYHIHVLETGAGRRSEFRDSWEQFLGDNCAIAADKNSIPEIIGNIIFKTVKPRSIDLGYEELKEDYTEKYK